MSEISQMKIDASLSDKRVLGIDISRYQPAINWNAVKNNGFQFVVAKATDGESSEDSFFKAHARDAKANGLVFGAYCFNRFSADPIKQADFFAKTVGDRTRWLVADIEFDKSKATLARFGDKYTKHMDEYAAIHSLKFLERITELTGVTPWIYFNAYHFTGFKNPERFSKYPGWVSNYLQKRKAAKDLNLQLVHLPPSYKKVVCWQFTDSHVAGKEICNSDGLDANICYLSTDELRKIAEGK